MKQALPSAWDEIADVLNDIPVAGERVRYAATIKALYSLPKRARILEVGCGSGRLLRALDALGYEHLVGSEISHARLKQVSRLGPSSAQLVWCSEVPFATATFDAVVSAAVVEHIVDPPGWLAELARVTKRDGIVSITTDTYMWTWLERLGLYHSIQPIEHGIWPSTLIRWAQCAGLELTGCGGFVNTPDQRGYFGKQLLRLVPRTCRLRRWLDRIGSPPTPSDETEAILEAVRDLPGQARINLWACVLSYECYYWFRKR